jgi:hypothetical protein
VAPARLLLANSISNSSPLFRVFANPTGSSKRWRVCGVCLEGDPVSIHSQHSSLKQAVHEATRANRIFAGITSRRQPRRNGEPKWS